MVRETREQGGSARHGEGKDGAGRCCQARGSGQRHVAARVGQARPVRMLVRVGDGCESVAESVNPCGDWCKSVAATVVNPVACPRWGGVGQVPTPVTAVLVCFPLTPEYKKTLYAAPAPAAGCHAPASAGASRDQPQCIENNGVD
jgi:hypothetical protein